MLYNIPLLLIHFILNSLYLLFIYPYFVSLFIYPSTPQLVTTTSFFPSLWICSFSAIYIFLLFSFFLESTYKWYYTVLAFTVWHSLLSIQILGPPTLLQMTEYHHILWLSNILLYCCCLVSVMSISLRPHEL